MLIPTNWSIVKLKSLFLRFLSAKPKQKDLEYIAMLASDGKIKLVIDKYYSSEKIAEAVRYLGEGHVSGKAVVKVPYE